MRELHGCMPIVALHMSAVFWSKSYVSWLPIRLSKGGSDLWFAGLIDCTPAGTLISIVV